MTDTDEMTWWLPASAEPHAGHRLAFRDWVACVVAGANDPVVRRLDGLAAERGPAGQAFVLAVRGHILDFDDTYPAGLAHLSSPTAAAAVAVGAMTGVSLADVGRAHGRAFDFMARLTRVHHPRLYLQGWHPTSVCGAPAAAVAAGTTLGLDEPRVLDAVRLAMLQTGGLQAAFGSAGKALQVGFAAQAGVRAALLAHAGMAGPKRVDTEWPSVYGGADVSDAVGNSRPDVLDNWIKAYPCCLQTHTSIEATCKLVQHVGRAVDVGPLEVIVHPLSLRAAPVTVVREPLETKFSIPYLVAFVLTYGSPPVVEDLQQVDPVVVERATRVHVRADQDLPQSTAVLRGSRTEFRRDDAVGSPGRPMTERQHAAKVQALGASQTVALLDPGNRPASELLESLLQPG